MTIAGADGYKDGWMVALDDGSGRIRTRMVGSLSALITDPTIELVAVGMPIGLADRGARICDQLPSRSWQRID